MAGQCYAELVKIAALVAALVAALALAGCSSPVDAPTAPVQTATAISPGWFYTVIENHSLTDAQLVQIGASLGAWETAVPGLHFTVVEGATPNTVPGDTVHTVFVQTSSPYSAGTLGETQRVSDHDDAWVSLDASSPDQGQTITHEIGHALGLVHTPSGIMCKDLQCASSSITSIDVAQFLATRGL